MSKYVRGTGPSNANLVICGEAPGAEEAAQGVPFVGASGRLLNSMLSSAGIDRKDCYVTNLIKHRPPRNDFGRYYYDPKDRRQPRDELIKAREQLHDELTKVQPRLVIALGNESLKALTNKMSIQKWRGSPIQLKEWIVLPTLHPAYVMRMYRSRVTVEHDLRKALRISSDPSWTPPEYQFKIDPSFREVMDFLKRDHKLLSFDIETVYENTMVRCLGFGDSPSSAICIPFMSSKRRPKPGDSTLVLPDQSMSDVGSHWTEEEEWEILCEVNRVLADPAIGLVAQNFPFDSSVLEREFGIHCAGFVGDTMVQQHTCYAELPKSLDYLTSMYTDTPRYSDYDPSSDLELWKYNCYDCAVTLHCYHELNTHLDSLGLRSFNDDLVNPTMKALTRAQHRGVKVNVQAREQIKITTEQEIEELQKKINQLVGEEINPSSPKQCGELLYDKLGLPIKKNKDGNKSTDADALRELKRKYTQHTELIDSILEYRRKKKLISSYLEVQLAPGDRMKTSYNVCGTVTGRISSSQTYDGFGGNLQNIPKGEFRRLFQADPGKVLLKCDLSQAEFRLVAWFARIRRLIDAYLEDPFFDIHTWNAMQVFGLPRERVHDKMQGDKSYRDIGKNGAYGGNYGMKPARASKTYDIEFRHAKYAIEKYHEVYPEIANVYWKEVEDQLNRTRTITNPLGRKRIFLDRLDDNMYREAYSHLCQSTVGDIINRAFAILDVVLPGGAAPVLQVHDEIVVQCFPKTVERCAQLIKNAMELPLHIDGVPEPLVIPCEIEVGKNWYDKEDLEDWLAREKSELEMVK